MRQLVNIHKTTATIITTIFFIIVFAIFMYRMIFISAPLKYTEVTCNHKANIYTNTLGIPHIIADDDDAMFFAFGYITARDRIWQIVKAKHIAQGRMAELFGADYVNNDIYMRAFELNDIAIKCYQNANPQTQNALNNYTDGINYYINTHNGKLQIEFSALQFTPDVWQPSDCFLLMRYWAFVLSNNIRSDIITSDIVNKLGVNGLDLFPKYPKNMPYILDKNLIQIKSDTSIFIDTGFIDNTSSLDVSCHSVDEALNFFTTDLVSSNSKREIATNIQNDILTSSYNYEYNSYRSSNLGSNTWAAVSNDGFITLANDSHLPTDLLGIWMQIKLTSPSYNIVGMCLPGVPIILSGRNDNISWGHSNMLIDDIDFFAHRFSDTNSSYYLDYSGNHKKIASVVDTIKIMGQLDSMYYIDKIGGCPVISSSDIARNYEAILKQSAKDKKNTANSTNTHKNKINNYLTYKWTGSNISDEIGAMLGVMRSSDWQEFYHNINGWCSPGLVFSYADTKGNIGAAPRGIIPIRAKDMDGRIVNPYWRYEQHWLGCSKPSNLPTIYNPSKGFVVAMNNGIFKEEGYISSGYALEHRVKRFYELSNNIAEYNFRDAQIMQKDVIDIYAKDMINRLFPILKRYKYLLNEQELKAYNKLYNWDYAMRINSTAASIFNMFISKMVYNTFADELGDDLYASYVYNSSVPLRKLLELCNDKPNSEWFDNINTTGKIERLNYIVVTSFKDAITELTKMYGTDNSDEWKYGKFHTVKLGYNFVRYPAVNSIIDRGTYSVAGGISTINCAEWNLLNPFEVTIGSAMRFIADMSSDNCYTIVLGGVSGDAMSSHYANQISFFNIGAYNTLSINRQPDERFKLEVKMQQ